VTSKRCATVAMARRPAEGVVDPAAGHRSDRGADQQGAGDVTLGVWGQPEILRHRPQRAVDHAGVVAEEQPTECCDDCNDVEPPLVRTGPEGGQRHAAGPGRLHGLVYVHRNLHRHRLCLHG
jgi:hypothetical protein